jgi:hypothetical protein
MACRACDVAEGVEVCLYCGHGFCSKHRDTAGGVTACTDCLRAEGERKRRAAAAKEARAAQAKGSASAPKRPEDGPIKVELPPKPDPLPEPKGGLPPVFWALIAGVVAAGYVSWVMIPGLDDPDAPLATWIRPAGGAGAFLVAATGVWAIAKSKRG